MTQRTRWLLAVAAMGLLWLQSPASACDLTTVKSDRWSTEHDNGVAWLKTPCGDRFYSLGVNVVNGGYNWREKDNKTWYSWKAFDPSLAAWVSRARQRLVDWG